MEGLELEEELECLEGLEELELQQSMAELGVVLLLEMDWGRSSAFLRRRTECFRDTWRLGGVDVAECWSWAIARDDRDRLKADKTLKAVGG